MFIAEVLNLGFDPVFIGYHRPLGLNEGKSRWSFRKRIRLAKDSLFSMSTFPLKLITYLGVFFFLLSILLSIFYLYIRVWGNNAFWGVPVPGWTSLVIIILFIGGLMMLSIGVLSEYVWRIFDEVKNRPGYIIRKKEETDETIAE
jgi:dolichol-phosphate mannosyltransferase